MTPTLFILFMSLAAAIGFAAGAMAGAYAATVEINRPKPEQKRVSLFRGVR